jgi:hypothetical protein
MLWPGTSYLSILFYDGWLESLYSPGCLEYKQRATRFSNPISAVLSSTDSEILNLGITAGLGNTFVKAVAAYGRWMGEEDKLLKKYWH